MSWAATSYVKKLRVAPNGQPITKGEKLVLFVLSDYYHDELGYAWASLSHLAQESLHTRHGVILTLQSLEKKGVLSIIRSEDAASKRVTNRYQFPAMSAACNVSTQPILQPDLVKSVDQASQATSLGLVKSVDQTSQATSLGLVKSVDQTSQATSLGLVKSVDHIFPSDLSTDLSKDSCAGTPPATARSSSRVKNGAQPKSASTYLAYAEQYQQRYGVEPVRNAKTNALLCQLVDRLGADEAPCVAAFYLGLDTPLYANAGHPLNLLVRDCEAMRMQWKRGPRRAPTVGPKAYQPAPPAVVQGEACPPEVAAKLARLLGREGTFSWPAAMECAG